MCSDCRYAVGSLCRYKGVTNVAALPQSTSLKLGLCLKYEEVIADDGIGGSALYMARYEASRKIGAQRRAEALEATKRISTNFLE